MPWRGARDPYHIWVSEIMLQQTQVETVIPYYTRWLKQFPTVAALAQAPLQTVLTQWEGLGYYSRARNLHRAAQQVLTEYGGQVPDTLEALLQLPGIGRYTAAAIASMAFGVDAAVLDGNVKRVLARVFDIRDDVKSPRGEKQLWALAESLVPAGRAGDYNQAVMDLGATICTPRAPACERCPVRPLCKAKQLGVQLERPIMKPRAPTPHYMLVVGVIHKAQQVLITQRAESDLLGGLWAFPAYRVLDESDLSSDLQRALKKELGVSAKIGAQTQTLHHAYTHFKVTALVFECRWLSGRVTLARANYRWVRAGELTAFPMGKVDRRIAEAINNARRKSKTAPRAPSPTAPNNTLA